MQNDNLPSTSGSDLDDTNNSPAAPPQVSLEAQRIIQPSPESAREAQVPQLQPAVPSVVSVPDAVSNAVQPVQSSVPQSIYPQPSAPPISQPQVGVSSVQMQPEKRRKPWLKIISLVLMLIVLAGFGFLVATNQNIRATVFRQKLVTYNYPQCKTAICTIKFYRGSKIAPYAPQTPAGQQPLASHMSLISPIIDGKTFITMRIDAYNISAASNDASKQLMDELSSCSTAGLTNGFKDYLPNLDTNINTCAVPSDDHSAVLGYATAFTSQKTNSFFIIQISEDFSINSQGQTTPVFNLANHQGEIQDILASLTVKSK